MTLLGNSVGNIIITGVITWTLQRRYVISCLPIANARGLTPLTAGLLWQQGCSEVFSATISQQLVLMHPSWSLKAAIYSLSALLSNRLLRLKKEMLT